MRRLGLRTIYVMAQKICQLYVRYYAAIALVAPQNTLTALDALNIACADFVSQTDIAAIYGDEV